eukprot:scaffold39616_cov19-Tisochrysis_lutea.AAC.2
MDPLHLHAPCIALLRRQLSNKSSFHLIPGALLACVAYTVCSVSWMCMQLKAVHTFGGQSQAPQAFKLCPSLPQADVLIENFRPGVMEKWGLGPADLKQSLIYTRISGYGQGELGYELQAKPQLRAISGYGQRWLAASDLTLLLDQAHQDRGIVHPEAGSSVLSTNEVSMKLWVYLEGALQRPSPLTCTCPLPEPKSITLDLHLCTLKAIDLNLHSSTSLLMQNGPRSGEPGYASKRRERDRVLGAKKGLPVRPASMVWGTFIFQRLWLALHYQLQGGLGPSESEENPTENAVAASAIGR